MRIAIEDKNANATAGVTFSCMADRSFYEQVESVLLLLNGIKMFSTALQIRIGSSLTAFHGHRRR